MNSDRNNWIMETILEAFNYPYDPYLCAFNIKWKHMIKKSLVCLLIDDPPSLRGMLYG